MQTPASLPSALSTFESHVGALLRAGTPVCVFLDYDGTLTPIVNDPDQARMPDATRDVLSRLSARHYTSIVTGRSTAKIHEFVRLDRGLYIAGSHGLHISGGNDAEPVNILHPVRPRARWSGHRCNQF